MTTELDELIEHSKIAEACNKLQALQKSLLAQVGLPHQSEREDQVEDFKNRLEALASPEVVQSFQTGATGKLYRFFTEKMFKNFIYVSTQSRQRNLSKFSQ